MLEIKGLKKSFKAKEVLKNLNLSIKEGESLMSFLRFPGKTFIVLIQ